MLNMAVESGEEASARKILNWATTRHNFKFKYGLVRAVIGIDAVPREPSYKDKNPIQQAQKIAEFVENGVFYTKDRKS